MPKGRQHTPSTQSDGRWVCDIAELNIFMFDVRDLYIIDNRIRITGFLSFKSTKYF